MKFILSLSLLSLLLLIGCETTPAVQSGGGPDFNPASYTTFHVLEPEPNPLAPAAPALYRTAKMVMVGSLRSKGLTEADYESADLVFEATGGAIPMVNASDRGFFWAGDGWFWYPVSYRRSNMNSQSSSFIVVNAFDNSSKQLVWQGVSSGAVNTSAAGKQNGMDALRAIMNDFPARAETAAP
jgi:hypothetical protein